MHARDGEHMDLQRPQKKSKLHARDGEDDTSYPSEECEEHDLDLLDEEPVIEDRSWTDMFDFRCYISETPQVYEKLIEVSAKIIEDGLKAYDEASSSFETKFRDLKEKRPCFHSNAVITDFRYAEEKGKRSLDVAKSMFPLFTVDVNKYIEYREGQLSGLKPAEVQYFEKLEQLAKIPNVEKMIKWLLYDVKDYKAIEQHSGLTKRDIFGINFYLWKEKNIYIPYSKEDLMDEEQYDESEMKDLLIQHKVALKKVSSKRQAYESIEAIVKEHAQKHEIAVFLCVNSFQGALDSVVYWVRIMRRQLELLLQKDVINNGYDNSFNEYWETVHCGIPRSCYLLDQSFNLLDLI